MDGPPGAAVSCPLTSVSTGGVHVSVVSGPGPILPRTFPGGQRRHVHALHGRGPFSPGGGRAIMHLLTVPVGIVTCGRHACVSLLKLGGGSGQSGLTSGWTSPSMRPQSSSVVPASGPVLVPVEALLLACVVLKVGSGSGPAGAPPSEPARQCVSVCVCVSRGLLLATLSPVVSPSPEVCSSVSVFRKPVPSSAPPHTSVPASPVAPRPPSLVPWSGPPALLWPAVKVLPPLIVLGAVRVLLAVPPVRP